MTIAKLLAQFAAKGGKIKKFKAQGVPKQEKIPTELTWNIKLDAPQFNPKHKIFHAPTFAKQDKAESIGRFIHDRKLKTSLQRVRARSLTLFSKGSNRPIKGRVIKAETQALKTARAFGLRAETKALTKFNVGKRRFGSQKSKFREKLSDAEARQLGFPPRNRR